MQLDEAPVVDDSASRRSESRHFINSEATEVTFRFVGADGEEKVLQGRLSDLSEGGLKVAINGRVPIGVTAQMTIFLPAMDFEMTRSATVRWQQPRDAKTWWTGCSVAEGFDDEIIEALAAANVLNRRRDPRYPVSKDVVVRWELEEQDHAGKMVNYSKGGFCIQAEEQPCSRGHRLLLMFRTQDGKQHTVPARVMWQGQTDDGYCVGCSFSTKDGFLLVRSFVEPDGVKRRSARRLPRRPEMSHWLAIAVLVLAIVQAMHLFLDQRDVLAGFEQSVRQYVVRPIRNQLRSVGELEERSDPKSANETASE